MFTRFFTVAGGYNDATAQWFLLSTG